MHASVPPQHEQAQEEEFAELRNIAVQTLWRRERHRIQIVLAANGYTPEFSRRKEDRSAAAALHLAG